MRRILAGVTTTLLLAGCSGVGIGGSGKASTVPSAPVVFWAPQSGMSFAFTWSDTTGETQYRLLEDPDSHSGYSQIAAFSADVTSYTLQGLPLLKRLNARYLLQACNNIGCTNSAPVHIGGNLAVAVGSVSGANTQAHDDFGSSLAISDDGSTFAVGAEEKQGGAVYVFVRSGNAWTQQAYLKASNSEADDFFGASLAMSGDGNTLAVGAYAEDSNATGVNGSQDDNSAASSGAAYVFTRSGIIWNQQAYLKASNTEAGDQFGLAVAMSDDGSTLAVTASAEDSNAIGIDGDQGDNSANGSGAVYLFTRSAKAWTQQAYVKSSNSEAADGFGGGLALAGDGNTLAVGAFGEDSNAAGMDGSQGDNTAIDSGAVYVFTRNGSAWSQQAYLKSSNSEAGDNFGNRVALSGDGNTLAAGAWHEDSGAAGIAGDEADNSADGSGAAYVFTRSSGGWNQQAYLKASNAEGTDNFGYSMALSADGNTLAVGAWREGSRAEGMNEAAQADNTFGIAGAAYVFTRSTNAWSQQVYVKTPERGATAWFSRSVELSGNGMTLAVGAAGGTSKVYLY